jgi:hypothetical protein
VQPDEHEQAGLFAEAKHHPADGKGSNDKNVQDQRQPEATPEKPERAEQRRAPCEAVADEAQRLGPFEPVRGRVRRLMHGIDAQR